MRKRNIYKDIVCFAVFYLMISALFGFGKSYAKEHKICGALIQAPEDLTAEIVAEFRKLSGICRFEPVDTAAVTIKLGSYTLQTEIVGMDFAKYPLKWKQVSDRLASNGAKEGEEKPAISMGNTPALFFGEEVFAFFTDQSGYPPLKSQVEKWTKQYRMLELTVTDESGRERKAKICGILSLPKDKVCMEKSQMQEIYGGFSHTTGGLMEIYGYQNMEKARGLLEDAGFLVQDSYEIYSK